MFFLFLLIALCECQVKLMFPPWTYQDSPDSLNSPRQEPLERMAYPGNVCADFDDEVTDENYYSVLTAPGEREDCFYHGFKVALVDPNPGFFGPTRGPSGAWVAEVSGRFGMNEAESNDTSVFETGVGPLLYMYATNEEEDSVMFALAGGCKGCIGVGYPHVTAVTSGLMIDNRCTHLSDEIDATVVNGTCRFNRLTEYPAPAFHSGTKGFDSVSDWLRFQVRYEEGKLDMYVWRSEKWEYVTSRSMVMYLATGTVSVGFVESTGQLKDLSLEYYPDGLPEDTQPGGGLWPTTTDAPAVMPPATTLSRSTWVASLERVYFPSDVKKESQGKVIVMVVGISLGVVALTLVVVGATWARTRRQQQEKRTQELPVIHTTMADDDMIVESDPVNTDYGVLELSETLSSSTAYNETTLQDL
mmetsp:Transcript_14668/g.46039  ORF Transcript_14668/g.46039 Transcript_14668/m.46039 type:complete len:416 (-) Transcript_14668:47-1294(-)